MMLRSHYTALNFLPKFLFEQFRRFANLYVFTFVASVCRVCACCSRPLARALALIGMW